MIAVTLLVRTLLALLMLGSAARAAFDATLLDRRVAGITQELGRGTLGVGLLDLADGSSWFLNRDRPFPMQSVYKAPIGAAVFRAIEERRLSLNDRVTIGREDLSVPFSPIARAFRGSREYTLRELLEAALGQSDNTAADVLMRLVGGPAAVTAFLRQAGIEGMRLDRYERDLQPEIAGLGAFRPEWAQVEPFLGAIRALPDRTRRQALDAYLADPRDTSTPAGAVRFLQKLASGEVLPQEGKNLLAIMAASQTGAKRIKAGVPAGSVVAHKTGTAADVLGTNPATNDIGIVTLPNGRRFAIAVFVSGSDKPQGAREKAIADVARAAVEALR
jgi:beta-lactamase class A